MKKISYGRQSIAASDVSAVSRVLVSDFLTQGPEVRKFEEALAEYALARYAVAVSSGTAALHIACLAAGLGKGEEAITTPITFLATPNSVIYSGARPVFADIDHGTVNIDPSRVKAKITKRTKAVLPVHFAGLAADMPAIKKAAGRKGVVIIEDACHALGAEYKHGDEWIKVGSCRHSDMAVFSFHPVKAITTGEGGAVLTNSEALYKKLLSLRSHGTYKDASTAQKGAWVYEMRNIGFNYRLTDIQSALGRNQLKRIGAFLAEREKIAGFYDKAFAGMEELLPGQKFDKKRARHARHLYLLRLNTEKTKLKRKEVFEALAKKGICAQVHYMPVHKQPFYRENGYSGVKCPNAEKYYEEVLSLPIYPGLRVSDVKRVIRGVKDTLRG